MSLRGRGRGFKGLDRIREFLFKGILRAKGKMDSTSSQARVSPPCSHFGLQWPLLHLRLQAKLL